MIKIILSNPLLLRAWSPSSSPAFAAICRRVSTSPSFVREMITRQRWPCIELDRKQICQSWMILPSFLSREPLSEEDDSSSDEDTCGLPKPPRSPINDSAGRPRPRPSYYYDSDFDSSGKAVMKKRGRRGGNKGIPVFEPTMKEFEEEGGFYGYVQRIEKYGMRSGIVKVIPPREWSDKLPSTAVPLKSVRLREPIEQHFTGSRGLYRVMNVAKTRIWNPAQWKEMTELDRMASPNFVSELTRDRSEQSTTRTPRGAKAKKREEMAESIDPAGDGPMDTCTLRTQISGRRNASITPSAFDDTLEASSSDKQLTPDIEFIDTLGNSPATPHASLRRSATTPPTELDEPCVEPVSLSKSSPTLRKRTTAMQRAEPTDVEWAAFLANFEELPHGMKKGDYTIELLREVERRYWRTLTIGDSPMYGADMAGSLFSNATTSWNVAHLGDLLKKLFPASCHIPGVVSPYLYFGSWRATFAWHVEDADLYSINYIHFGAPKFWYAIPQDKSEQFERVMEGLFPTDRAHCPQFLRHKSFLASPKILANAGITANRVVQLPGEYILTYPRGYHSGFNLGHNCAESVNFATERWLPVGRTSKACTCISDSVNIDVDAWLAQAADLESMDTPELPSSLVNTASKPRAKPVDRKRSLPGPDPASTADEKPTTPPKKKLKAEGQHKIARGSDVNTAAMTAASTTSTTTTTTTTRKPNVLTTTMITTLKNRRKTSMAMMEQHPCALCVDRSKEQLVQIDGEESDLWAHRICVVFTPSTWIEVDGTTGYEVVKGFDDIEKARWRLKCQLCSEKHGTKVQCTKGKCPKAFHVTCALLQSSGVHLDATVIQNGASISMLESASGTSNEPSPAPPLGNPLARVMASDANNAVNVQAADSSAPVVEEDGSVKLVVLCRFHNPTFKKIEEDRKAAELLDRVSSIALGSALKFKVMGQTREAVFAGLLEDGTSILVLCSDGITATIGARNIVWPDSVEVQQKKESRAAEDAKAAQIWVYDQRSSAGVAISSTKGGHSTRGASFDKAGGPRRRNGPHATMLPSMLTVPPHSAISAFSLSSPSPIQYQPSRSSFESLACDRSRVDTVQSSSCIFPAPDTTSFNSPTITCDRLPLTDSRPSALPLSPMSAIPRLSMLPSYGPLPVEPLSSSLGSFQRDGLGERLAPLRYVGADSPYARCDEYAGQGSAYYSPALPPYRPLSASFTEMSYTVPADLVP